MTVLFVYKSSGDMHYGQEMKKGMLFMMMSVTLKPGRYAAYCVACTAHLILLAYCNYVALAATYIRLLHGKIGFFWGGGGFGPSSVKMGRAHIVLG